MVASATAPCFCVATSDGARIRIDSSGCRLNHIMQSFRDIVRMASELRSVEARSEPSVESIRDPERAKQRVSSRGIARLMAASQHVNRVLEEEGIPHGPLTCYACQRRIDQGEIRVLHGPCDEKRFTDTVDLQALKDLVRRSYPAGHPVREIVLTLDDQVARVEMPLIAKLVFRLANQA
jgi:hypothetical protein